MMHKEGKKIWNSEAGASLMNATLGVKELSPQDWETVNRLKALKVKQESDAASTPWPSAGAENKT